MGPCTPFLEHFHKKTILQFQEKCNETPFRTLSLSNIIKHGESDVERQNSIQGIHLSAFCNYFWKREGRFKTLTSDAIQFQIMGTKSPVI